MTCGVVARRSLRDLGSPVARPRSPHAPRPEFEILGTWDYKWPLNTTIKIAFQQLPEMQHGDFREIRNQVIALARRWEQAIEESGSDKLIEHCPKLVFLSEAEDLAPPLGARNSLTDQHRSPFVSGVDVIGKGYDVLISMQPLPVIRMDPFRPLGQELERVIFPISELGSYTRRADYAAPTMYLGPFGNLYNKKLPLAVGTREYLKTKIGQHVIVHEFGHVYGLPHIFQQSGLFGENNTEAESEARKTFYLAQESLIKRVQKEVNIKLTKTLAREHVTDIWPGSAKFSDRVKFTTAEINAHFESGELSTVMGFPYYGKLINVRSRGASIAPRKIAKSAIDPLTKPGTKDLELLEIMYAAP